MATTYCDSSDVAFVMSQHAIDASIDDNIDGGVSPTTEAGFVADAIELAADDLNSVLSMRYKLSDLAGNTWCKWQNARKAAGALLTRRGNPLPASLAAQIQKCEQTLEGIINQTAKIPNQAESFDHSPAVSNYLVKRAARHSTPLIVDLDTSTRKAPESGIKREGGTINTWPI